MLKKKVFKVLEQEEGFRSSPYHCSEGYPTIGIGSRIGPKGADLKYYDFEVSKVVAGAWLADKTCKLIDVLETFDFYANASDDRKVIFVSMAYQMGINGLQGFGNMIRAAEAGDWEQAAVEALDSRWHHQTPTRAKRHAEVLRTGELKFAYGEGF